MIQAQIHHDIDFERQGFQLAHADISWCSNTVEIGSFQLPVYVANNGPGARLLLSGGVHGDEYEGPLALWEMLRAGDFNEVQGQLIVIPAMNPPALAANQRRSPLDGQDMNRSFPGKSDSPTDVITRFISTNVIPRVDAVFDLHAGGEVEFIAPSIMTMLHNDQALLSNALEALYASGLPVVLATKEFDAHGMIDVEATRQGKIFGCAELGSVGASTPASVEWTKSAIRNLLRHFNLLDGLPETIVWRGSSKRHVITLTESVQTVIAHSCGLFRPTVSVGDSVFSGDVLGLLCPVLEPNQQEIEVKAPCDGFVYALGAGRSMEKGDLLATLGRLVPGTKDIQVKPN